MKKKRPEIAQEGTPPWVRDLAVCLVLAALCIVVFLPVRTFLFLHYDDAKVVTGNPRIMAGLSPSGVAWAFTNAHFAIWMPITSLTHMLDASISKTAPGGHHLASLIWHILAVIVLYLAIARATGRPWHSAVLAALFAVHPQRVEAVAWVASRKEILCGLFFFATLWAYAGYAARRGRMRLLLFTVLGALALMSKPMAVSLPAVLLLLDFWPLRRWAGGKKLGLLLEKAPLILLGLAVAAVAVMTQPESAAQAGVMPPPLLTRAGGAIMNLATYFIHACVPIRLAAHYPVLPDTITGPAVALSASLLLMITALAALLRTRPYLAVGWCWFLVTLVPVLGLVSYGNAAMAERYMYIPQVGLLIMAVWGIADIGDAITVRLKGRLPVVRGVPVLLPLLAVLAVLAAAALCRWQLGFWRDTQTLFTRTLELEPRSALAHTNLAYAAIERRDRDTALRHYREAVALEPDHAVWRYNLGSMLVLVDLDAEAIPHLRRSLELNPENSAAHMNLGTALLYTGHPEEALPSFEEALRLDPEKTSSLVGYADCLARLDRRDEAAAALARALKRDPGNREIATRLERVRTPAK